MTIVAHLRKDKNGRLIEQTVRDHLVDVAEKMEAAATPWGIGGFGETHRPFA